MTTTVSGVGNSLSQVTLDVAGDHSYWMSDLGFTLTSPSAAQCDPSPSCAATVNFDLYLTDSAPGGISCPIGTQTAQGSESFAVFVGENLNGLWTLDAADCYDGDGSGNVFSATLNVFATAGGGGDPHLWAPAFAPRTDLVAAAPSMPTDAGAGAAGARHAAEMDVRLLASADVTVTGHVRAQPGRFFFTALTVGASASVSSSSLGRAVGMTIEQEGAVHACHAAAAADATVDVGGKAFLAVHCRDGRERAAASAFESVVLPQQCRTWRRRPASRRGTDMEFFFVQKEGGAAFGLFDSSVRYRDDSTVAGLYTNVPELQHRTDGADGAGHLQRQRGSDEAHASYSDHHVAILLENVRLP